MFGGETLFEHLDVFIVEQSFFFSSIMHNRRKCTRARDEKEKMHKGISRLPVAVFSLKFVGVYK